MTEPEPAPRRRTPDLLTMTAGAGALCVSVFVLLGGAIRLQSVDARWALATVAVLVGVLLIAGSLRPRRSR